LIDGGASGGEVPHHLRRDLGRVGRDALRSHAVIAGEDENPDIVEAGRIAPLPKPQPFDHLLEAAEAPRRLGQHACAASDRRRLSGMTAGKIETGRAKVGN
jgi:hypothetical protein